MNKILEPKRDELEEAQEVERMVRHYAQNRSLPVAIFLAIFLLLILAIGGPSSLGGMAYRSGNMILFVICLVLVLVAVAATIYISIPRWGGRRLQQFASWVYADEGQVTISTPRVPQPWIMAAIVLLFVGCVLGSVVLGLLGYLPTGKYMQPISALYVVPFLVALNFLMRPMTGYIPLLWPFLYALHALAIVAGAPIVFTGPWEPLNMLVPIIGYGLLTAMVGHLYSRWALHRVRAIVGRQLDEAQLEQDEDRV